MCTYKTYVDISVDVCMYVCVYIYIDIRICMRIDGGGAKIGGLDLSWKSSSSFSVLKIMTRGKHNRWQRRFSGETK